MDGPISREESWSLAQLGYLLYERRREEQSQRIFVGLTRLEGPHAGYAWYMLGLIARRRGSPGRSIECFQRAMELGADDGATRLALAETLLETDQSEAARQWLDSIEGAASAVDDETLRRARAVRRRWFGSRDREPRSG
jgi:Tfp pilus assembly protein PilF